MLKSLLLFASLLVATAHAAPQRMEVAYDLYRNGQKLGQVTDTYVQKGRQYTLTSEMRATGPLKMLWPGSIRLESTGSVTQQGLRPEQFRHARSDAPEKLATARLDWTARHIAYRYKSESWITPELKTGTQDQLSQLYQFMFAPKLPTDYTLQVTSGRKLSDYRYARQDGGVLATPLGRLTTLQYRRIVSDPDDKAITVWVAPARGNLPVRIRVVEDGVTLEQRLARARIQS
ncbi:MAG: hypothetical protein B7Y26_03515 [Hydrogenophilales bacterium 16-64-46]|nr:MAG: hypothetical protein B7Z32_03215 [Hydrogenophilales bacterium 12-64-13]OYZ06863.1 MAG: hypothetical protein B7Y26_03515 [Hydrogenophilales bacterium 16-64-46]OZA37007.1 MAG: hypothetical protein B7X87_11910 [Hydrogenophilales bacterium 17-64-34]HQS99889.1 DUF3108 domain-containing protein [Thiobacillus sp.]